MNIPRINSSEFSLFQSFIYERAGIYLGPEKKTLVESRLSKRLRHFNFSTFSEYYSYIVEEDKTEIQKTVDLLTTNETYFFREKKHFDFLRDDVLKHWRGGTSFRVWSAASSSGEEAYSLAMLLDDALGGRPWDVYGSDINHEVLAKAKKGIYAQTRIEGIERAYLKKYCLKGVDEHAGTMLISKSLRSRVRFMPVNLKESLANIPIPPCHVVFLRNVLIYFDKKTKQNVIEKIVDHLLPGGYLVIGHSETIKDINIRTRLISILPTVYQKPMSHDK